MRNRMWVLFFLLSVSFQSIAVTLTNLVVENKSSSAATIRCQLSGQFHYRTFTLNHPDRVIIDFTETVSSSHIPKSRTLSFGLIKQARQGHPTPRTLRFVFDVGAPSKINAVATKNNVTLQLTALSGAVTPISIPRTASHQVVKKQGRGNRDVIIVLDPGHGGHDPGAIGPSHRIEKNVTLAIAKTLKQRIDKQPGMRAVLTRSGDYYIGLRERLNIARKYNADVFISIHADAFIHSHSHGASVFALSQRGATSEAARWLAEKENYSELGGVDLKHLDDKNGLIRSVLLDLSQTATTSAGLQLGSQVLQHLSRMTALHNRRVEQARFVVLKSPDTPSILIETGFISNPEDARNLTDPRYQVRLSEAIFAGLKRYFWEHPPHGTRLETLSNVVPHRGWFSRHVHEVA